MLKKWRLFTMVFSLFIFTNFFGQQNVQAEQVVYQQEKPQFKFQNVAGGNSFLAATSVVQDQQGFIWIGTQNGLYKFDGIESKLFVRNEKQHSLQDNYIRRMLVDSRGYIWLGYYRGGISRFNPVNQKFIHFSSKTNNHNKQAIAFNGSRIEHISEDSQGNIWVATNTGLAKIISSNADVGNTTSQEETLNVIELTQAPFHNQEVYSVTVDQQQRVWVASELGLYYSQLSIGSNKNDNINNKLIFSLYEIPTADEQNIVVTSLLLSDKKTLWLGSRNSGAFKIDLTIFKIDHDFSKQGKKLTSEVAAIKKDSKGNIWFATHNGLGFSFKNSNELFIYQHTASNSTSIKANRIDDLIVDKQQQIWLASGQSIQTLNIQSAVFKSFAVDKKGLNTLHEKSLSSVAFDNNDKLWFGGSTSGVYQQQAIDNNQKANSFIHHQQNNQSIFSFDYFDISGFLQDSKEQTWVGTRRNGVYKISADQQVKSHYQRDVKNKQGLSSNSMNQIIFEDSLSQIWVGNESGVNLYNPDDDTFSQVRLLYPLPFKMQGKTSGSCH
jgi:ligand-binding sensor domain-containing protein